MIGAVALGVAVVALVTALTVLYLQLKFIQPYMGKPDPEPQPQSAESLEGTVVQGKKPLEIDPDNPPRHTSYNPVVGHEPKTCDCHDEPLEPGQQVLWWPRVDEPGAVFIFCPRMYESVLGR